MLRKIPFILLAVFLSPVKADGHPTVEQFDASYDAPFGYFESEGWGMSEEVVKDDACYDKELGNVSPSDTIENPFDKASSLRVWANSARAVEKSNHVIANKRLSHLGQEGVWKYELYAMIPRKEVIPAFSVWVITTEDDPTTTGVNEEQGYNAEFPESTLVGQTGPEFAVFNTTRDNNDNFWTYEAAIQYQHPERDDNLDITSPGQWAIWVPDTISTPIESPTPGSFPPLTADIEDSTPVRGGPFDPTPPTDTTQESVEGPLESAINSYYNAHWENLETDFEPEPDVWYYMALEFDLTTGKYLTFIVQNAGPTNDSGVYSRDFEIKVDFRTLEKPEVSYIGHFRNKFKEEALIVSLEVENYNNTECDKNTQFKVYYDNVRLLKHK